MDTLPSMWRTELWHPLVVHFPIALLLVGTLLRGAGALLNNQRLSFLVPAGQTLLATGTVGAWAAVYTGSLADAIVVRSLCDPTVLESHENLAYNTAYLFSGALVLDALRTWIRGPLLRRLLAVGTLGLALAGSGTLLYVGHLGSKLVYQQAAAVHQPADDCAAFE